MHINIIVFLCYRVVSDYFREEKMQQKVLLHVSIVTNEILFQMLLYCIYLVVHDVA